MRSESDALPVAALPVAALPVAALPAEWRRRAEELARFAPPVAEAFRFCAERLEAAARTDDDSVTLQEAHAIGGYTIDRLQKLVASGAIANAGRRGKPRIRRADVPVKPGHASIASLRSSPAAPISERRREVASVTSRRST